MRIIHFALSCFYIEGYQYQENVLPTIHAKNGHKVLVVASCVSYNSKGEYCFVEPAKYHSDNGFDVIRVPYRKVFSKGILRRIRKYEGIYKIIEAFEPDVMYFHGISSLELNTLIKYKKHHNEVALFVDNHADRNNSASSMISLLIQHKLMYKYTLKKALPYVEKILCPSIECMDFCREVYGVQDDLLEFYPLGGTIISWEEQEDIREKIRKSEAVSNECTVFTHSGKMDARKRTLEIIEAFHAVENPNFRLWIIGVLMDDIKDKVQSLILQDNRICYLGWKKSDELRKYLYATDFYVQPGGQSATMQNAMCCGCAVMLYPHKSHKPYLQGNGYYVKDVNDMKRAFDNISENPSRTEIMKKRSFEIACEILDYDKLAERVCKSLVEDKNNKN